MHKVHAAAAGKLPGDVACPHPEQRIRRTPINHRRPAPSREGECAIRHDYRPDPRVDDRSGLRLQHATGRVRHRWCRVSGGGGGTGDQRDVHVVRREVADEIVNGALQAPADAVQRRHGPGDHRDTHLRRHAGSFRSDR